MKSVRAFVLLIVGITFLINVAEACDCDYHPGGCTISSAPAAGYKCKCRYLGFWTCDGLELQCDSNEHCPADCMSRECCNRGGGDCGGYFPQPEKLN